MSITAKVNRPSLQSSAQVLSFNLQQLAETCNGHRQFLKEAHAYPLPSFPGHADEKVNTLGQLLRKKLDPNSEEWVDEYTVKAEKNGTGVNEAAGGMSKEELKDLWNWAGPTSNGIVGPMLEEDGELEDDFTNKEREEGVENVVTGLKRKLGGEGEGEREGEGDGKDEDDEEDEMMEDVMPAAKAPAVDEPGIDPSLPPLPLESVLRFISTGAR